jgi:hypothetical protein
LARGFRTTISINRRIISQAPVRYIAFTKEWNERARNSMPADAAEFDRFEDIVKSSLWATIATAGVEDGIVDAPTFFECGDVTRRIW